MSATPTPAATRGRELAAGDGPHALDRVMPVLLGVEHVVDEVVPRGGGAEDQEGQRRRARGPTSGRARWPAAGAANTRMFLDHWRGRIARTRSQGVLWRQWACGSPGAASSSGRSLLAVRVLGVQAVGGGHADHRTDAMARALHGSKVALGGKHHAQDRDTGVARPEPRRTRPGLNRRRPVPRLPVLAPGRPGVSDARSSQPTSRAMTRGSARSQWPAPGTTCSSEGPVAASARARALARGTSGSSEPWTSRRGRPFESAASSTGCSTESSLAQASTDDGNPGVLITPVRRHRARNSSVPPGQLAPPRRACPGRPRRRPARRRPPGAATSTPPKPKPTATRVDVLGDLVLGDEAQVVEPAQGGEVAGRLAGAAQRGGDDLPAGLAGQAVGQRRDTSARGRRPRRLGPWQVMAEQDVAADGCAGARRGGVRPQVARGPGPEPEWPRHLRCRCVAPAAPGGTRDRRGTARTTWRA